MSQGLLFINRLIEARDYEEKRSLLEGLWSHRRSNLAACLLDLNEFEWGVKSEALTTNPLQQWTPADVKGFVELYSAEAEEDQTSGALDAWWEVHEQEWMAQWILIDFYKWPRRGAYVFWDAARIKADSGALLSRFRDMVADGDYGREDPTDEDYVDMQRSSEKRSVVYQKGGSGWWSENDQSKTVWSSGNGID